jgi:hypothetical protein
MQMPAFPNKGFSVTKEPFSGWADDLQAALGGIEERLTDEIGEVFAAVGLDAKERIRQDPNWPDEAAGKVDVRIDGEGGIEFAIDHPGALDKEYGTAEEAPSPVMQTAAATAASGIDRDMTEAIWRATGL